MLGAGQRPAPNINLVFIEARSAIAIALEPEGRP